MGVYEQAVGSLTKIEAPALPYMLLFNTCQNILGKGAKLCMFSAARNNNATGALET